MYLTFTNITHYIDKIHTRVTISSPVLQYNATKSKMSTNQLKKT